MADEQDKSLHQKTTDSLTTRHIEQHSDVLLRTLTTAHIEQKIGNVAPTQSQGKTGDTTSGGQPGQQQQPGAGEKK